jgi:hypothetical protein
MNDFLAFILGLSTLLCYPLDEILKLFALIAPCFWKIFKSRKNAKAIFLRRRKWRATCMNDLPILAYDDKILPLKRDNAVIIKAASRFTSR